MNREIKFRAWGTIGKQWLWITGIETAETSRSDGYTIFGSYGAGIFHDGDYVGSDGIVLMQYTGLKDRNGKDIYEGDVVDYYRHKYRRKLGVVKFGEYEQDGSGGEYVPTKCLGFYVETIKVFPSPLELEFNEEPYEAEEEKTVSILEFDYEVIGNIFENPELISNV